MRQFSFSSMDYAAKKKATKHEFLAEMSAIAPCTSERSGRVRLAVAQSSFGGND